MSEQPTWTERRLFGELYGDLAGPLGLFHDPDGKTDTQITDDYIAEESQAGLLDVVRSGRAFLNQKELPFSLVASAANRNLLTESEQRQWLSCFLERLEQAIEARNGAEPSEG